jgi:outer membrane lipoprotein-sorting protein
MAASLADVLLLMHGADLRFGSVRMVVREWSHHERLQRAWTRHEEGSPHSTIVVSLPGSNEPGEPQPEEGTERTRVWWRKPDHVRLEHDDGDGGSRVEVAAGERWWSWASEWGATSNEAEPEVQSEAQQAPFPQLLQPELLLSALRLELVGSGLQAGRRAIALRGVPRRRDDHAATLARLALGADAHDLMVDAERGILLRIASEIDGEPFSIAEVEEVAFDETFAPETFTLDLPPGEAFHPIGGQTALELTLDEAARRAPFTVLAPPRIPRGAELWVSMVEASERPPLATQVHIAYHVERGGFSMSLTQAAVEDAEDRGLVEDGELVERDGRAVVWRQMGNQRQLETEHLGTHVVMMSDSIPIEALIDLMLSLEPAPTEPPELVAP